MRRFFVPFPLKGKRVRLGEAMAHRLLHVLRMKKGDRLVLFDPKGTEWVATIIGAERQSLWVELIERLFTEREAPILLSLFQGIPKGEKMDFIVQKATELGVWTIIPMVTHRTIVQLSPERAEKKRQRWQRIAEAAAEQCGARFVPRVMRPFPFHEAIRQAAGSDLWLFFYEQATMPLREVLKRAISSPVENPSLHIALMVGPEGGFDPKEVEEAERNGARVISLGRRILRTETATLVALALVLYELGALA